MSEFIAGQAVGFFLGLVGSFGTWWILTHFLTPKIEFADFISETHYARLEQLNYRIKFKNCGRRDIHDLSVRVFIAYFGMIDGRPNNVLSFQIALSVDGDTEFSSFLLPASKSKIVRLVFDKSHKLFNSGYISLKDKDDLRSGNMSLARLFDITDYDKNYLIVHVSGVDAWSGSKRVFKSRRLYKKNIQPTTFDGLKMKMPLLTPSQQRHFD